jgi:predicted DNA-binding protein (MmcQ/YjbR family)
MNVETFRTYCLSKKEVTESFPFNVSTLVFKVAGKMFALCDVDTFAAINLKCDPDRSNELREIYTGINPGYHMNKHHWNTVSMAEDVPENLIYELIDHSYDLIVQSLPRKKRDELQIG